MPGLKVERKYYTLAGYEVFSYYSTDDEVYVAEVEQLPGCAVDGATREECIAELQRFMPEWIGEMTDMGKEIPSPKFEPGYALV